MGNQLVYFESFGLVSLLFVDIYAKCLDLVTSVGVLKGVDLGGDLSFCIYLFVAQEGVVVHEDMATGRGTERVISTLDI